MEFYTYAVIALIFLFASSVQSSIGFGFALVAISPVLMLIDSILAVQLIILGNFLMSLSMWPVIQKRAPRKLLLLLVCGNLLGFPIGVFFVNLFEIETIKVLVAILILTVTAQTFWKLCKKDRNHVHNNKNSMSFIVGVVSGALTSGLSTPGPAIMIYLTRSGLTKDEIRATILTFYIFAYGGATVAQYFMVGFSKQLYILTVITIPFIFLGAFLGHKISKIINESVFTWLVLTVLSISAFYTLSTVLF